MVLDDVIVEVRRLLQDETAPYRYSDAFLLGFCNQSLQRIQLIRPDLFACVDNVACTSGTVIQSAPTDSLRIIEVYSVVGGNGIIEAKREVLDQTVPTWMNDTAGAAVNWMRNVRNPNKYFLYPKAPSEQSVVMEYSQVPPTYDGTTSVAHLADAYYPTVVDCTVFLAESIDNEHVTSGRAKMFFESFVQSLGASTAARAITDTETSGEYMKSTKPQEVV